MLDIIDNVDIDHEDIIDIIVAMTSSSAATSRRQFSMVKHRGGVSRMMLLCLPVMATSTCRVFIPNMISEASSALATWSLLVVSCHHYYDCWSPPCPPCPPQSRDSGRGRSRARRPHTGTWWWKYRVVLQKVPSEGS